MYELVQAAGIAYVATMPAAVQGQSGHSDLLRVANVIFHGFGLSEAEGWQMMLEYNSRCCPPWDLSNPRDEKDFRRKIQQAIEKPLDGQPFGYLQNQIVHTAPQADITMLVSNLNTQPNNAAHPETLRDKERVPERLYRGHLEKTIFLSDHGILTLFKADFRVKMLVPQATEKASPASKAVSGKKCSASFAKFDRNTSSWKTCVTCLFGDAEPSSATFPAQGSMHNGACYPLHPSEQNINATACGFWRKNEMFPTLSTYGVGGSWGKQKFKKIFGIDSMQMNPMWLANIMGFPTDWTHCGASATPKYLSVQQWLLPFLYERLNHQK